MGNCSNKSTPTSTRRTTSSNKASSREQNTVPEVTTNLEAAVDQNGPAEFLLAFDSPLQVIPSKSSSGTKDTSKTSESTPRRQKSGSNDVGTNNSTINATPKREHATTTTKKVRKLSQETKSSTTIDPPMTPLPTTTKKKNYDNEESSEHTEDEFNDSPDQPGFELTLFDTDIISPLTVAPTSVRPNIKHLPRL